MNDDIVDSVAIKVAIGGDNFAKQVDRRRTVDGEPVGPVQRIRADRGVKVRPAEDHMQLASLRLSIDRGQARADDDIGEPIPVDIAERGGVAPLRRAEAVAWAVGDDETIGSIQIDRIDGRGQFAAGKADRHERRVGDGREAHLLRDHCRGALTICGRGRLDTEREVAAEVLGRREDKGGQI